MTKESIRLWSHISYPIHPRHTKLGLVAEVVLAAVVVIVPLSVHAGFFTIFTEPIETATAATPEVIKTGSPLDVPVLSAALNAEPVSRGGADIVAQDGVLVVTGPVSDDEIDAAKQGGGEISVYTVREGDTLSDIAEMFDVTTNTILWANDLTSAKSINPGDALVILPVVGVRHVVKSGDTIAAIAKKYDGNAEEIVAYNQLADVTDITVGETLVIPGGAIHTAAKSTGSSNTTKTAGGSSLIHPAPGAIKTQGIHGYNGVDFGGAIGTTIRASGAGEVIVAKSGGWNGGYGNYIVIKHPNGVQTLYAHLSSLSVGAGAMVAAGETIGAMGNSGRSTGPHLHFEVRGGKNPF